MTEGGNVNNITIFGKRWFQKSYGNTYHTAAVYIDGEFLEKSEKQYGYDEAFVQTAEDILVKRGQVPLKTHANGGRDPLWQYCRENGIRLLVFVSDVSREKDL
jgi:hypothetical protein